MRTLQEKKEKLTARLKELGRVAVAYSSGVDSTFLLAAAHETLGENVTAVIGKTASFPEREYRDAVAFCEKLGVRYSVVEPDQMAVEGFRENPPERCYLCKKAILGMVREAAGKHGLACVVEGSNLDDLNDYRPGARAVRELGVRSPLREAELTKAEIRALSRRLALPTAEKPAMACLASRVPTGEALTAEKLRRVEAAENYLASLGLTQRRVRVHGDLARIETLPEEAAVITEQAAEVDAALRRIGFRYVALDLGGYRMGNMNR